MLKVKLPTLAGVRLKLAPVPVEDIVPELVILVTVKPLAPNAKVPAFKFKVVAVTAA